MTVFGVVRCGGFAAKHGGPPAWFRGKLLTLAGFGDRRLTIVVVVGCEFSAANHGIAANHGHGVRGPPC